MNTLYKTLDISKQAFHKHTDRDNRLRSEQGQLLVLIHELREHHPTMGMRDMYYKLLPDTMGRDAFETFCKSEGLMSERPHNARRTTDSCGVIRFDDLLTDFAATGINQAYQSDITYFEVGQRFFYLTFILDSFSRLIAGYSVSKRLTTEQTTLPALKQAVAIREKQGLSVQNAIFHSDGGGQYYDKEFLKFTKKKMFKNSMCEYAWENGKAERINGVIKNNYLKHRNIQTFEDLVTQVDRAVKLYNTEKPHIKLAQKNTV